MEIFLNRYRNITVLAVVMIGQLFLLAYQVKTRQDVRLIRVWAVSGILPLARIVDLVRDNTIGLLDDYSDLWRAKEENLRLKKSLDDLKLENQFLKNELETADRGKSLSLFQAQIQSRTAAARVIARGTGTESKVVWVDRGSRDGVARGMAVITPDGIVGKVSGAYPGSSQVILITDPSFAAGVVSQKHRVHGTLKGQGHSVCSIEYIQNEEPVEAGEWFYTSGDDKIFPKGLRVGQVSVARQGKMFFREVFLAPSGLQGGMEAVLIVLDGVHEAIPDNPEVTASPELHLLKPPPPDSKLGMEANHVIRGVFSTDADDILDRYKRIGAAQGHEYGAGSVPNFNINPAPPAAGARPER